MVTVDCLDPAHCIPGWPLPHWQMVTLTEDVLLSVVIVGCNAICDDQSLSAPSLHSVIAGSSCQWQWPQPVCTVSHPALAQQAGGAGLGSRSVCWAPLSVCSVQCLCVPSLPRALTTHRAVVAMCWFWSGFIKLPSVFRFVLLNRRCFGPFSSELTGYMPSEGGSSNVQCPVQCTVQTLGAPPLSVHLCLYTPLPSAPDVIHPLQPHHWSEPHITSPWLVAPESSPLLAFTWHFWHISQWLLRVSDTLTLIPLNKL